MDKSFEAIIEANGKVHLREPVQLNSAHLAIVTIIDEPLIPETALLSESALAKDWERYEEDEAWSHLQQVK